MPLWVRHVVIPGLTDGEAHIRALARMAGQFHNLQKVELLGFRKLCLEKYGAMGVPFPLADTPEMDAAALCRLEGRGAGENCRTLREKGRAGRKNTCAPQKGMVRYAYTFEGVVRAGPVRRVKST